MRKVLAPLSAISLLLAAPMAFADVASIRADALPQETAVLAALDDARQLEPYSSSFTPNWEYAIDRKEVFARLEKDLGFLSLALLTGQVAHYAYNLDVPDAHDKAIDAFDQAQKLAATDLRVPWFRAALLCQLDRPAAGAVDFLSIEESPASDQLPAAFWTDYLACATVTNMPAHALRAADHLTKLHAPESQLRTFLTDVARKRFDPFDPKKTYAPNEVWEASTVKEGTAFTSTTCGIRLTAQGHWTVNQMALTKGTCVAYFSTGPYKATTRDLHPSILVMVQSPKEVESLKDFFARFLHDGTFEPFTPSRCPTTNCLAMKGVQPHMYKADGDGHGHILAFERDQPNYPGLSFESPMEAPKTDGTEGPKFYHPSQVRQRIPGKLYYLVLVDTAASIEDSALKDLDFFLQHLTVE
jgi:hypothetical protein